MSHVHLTLDIAAACDCGDVTVALNGPVVSMFQCACEHCQKVSGSGHSSVVLLPADAVVVQGETVAFSRPAESGATFTRHFCPRCATTVRAESSRAPGLSIMPVGLFASDNDWFAPNQLIFARSHCAWDLIDTNLPRYNRYRETSA